jgi:hypothetical protein
MGSYNRSICRPSMTQPLIILDSFQEFRPFAPRAKEHHWLLVFSIGSSVMSHVEQDLLIEQPPGLPLATPMRDFPLVISRACVSDPAMETQRVVKRAAGPLGSTLL